MGGGPISTHGCQLGAGGFSCMARRREAAGGAGVKEGAVLW